MKKLMSSVLAIGTTMFLASGLVGCDQVSKVQEKETVTTPGGTTTTETTKKITSSGANPPTNSEGQKVEPQK